MSEVIARLSEDEKSVVLTDGDNKVVLDFYVEHAAMEFLADLCDQAENVPMLGLDIHEEPDGPT